jgi:hypothetical protein
MHYFAQAKGDGDTQDRNQKIYSLMIPILAADHVPGYQILVREPWQANG